MESRKKLYNNKYEKICKIAEGSSGKIILCN